MASTLSINHAIADISQKLYSPWIKPVVPDLQHLKEYFEKPLDPDWKIPLSYNQWKEYLANELSPAIACSDEDLELSKAKMRLLLGFYICLIKQSYGIQ